MKYERNFKPKNPIGDGYSAFIKKIEGDNNTDKETPKKENKEKELLSYSDALKRAAPDPWEERATWIIVGILIVIGMLFLSNISGDSTYTNYCDGPSNSYCP